MVQRLKRLLLDALLCGDDQDDEVRDLRPSEPHGRKRFVARRVDEDDGLALDLHLVGTDLLGNATLLAGSDAALADVVQQGRFSVVRHDRRTRLE